MKRINLFKQASHAQVGHVYEHIFAMRLSAYLQARGLFTFLDYDIEAKTAYTGVIQLTLTGYGEASVDAIKGIDQLDVIPIEQDEIDGALIQIFAEKQVDLGEIDMDELKAELSRLTSDEWKSTPSADETVQLNDEVLNFVDKEGDDFGDIVQSISLDMKEVEISKHDSTLLFLVISRIIAENLREVIPDESLCFTESDRFYIKGDVLIDENTYRVDNRQVTAVDGELSSVRQFVEKMARENFVQKLIVYLEHASDQPLSSLSKKDVFEKTGLETGPVTWHELAEPEMIGQILNAIKIDFALNDSRVSLKVSDIVMF